MDIHTRNVRNIASENLRVICAQCYDKEIPHLVPSNLSLYL